VNNTIIIVSTNAGFFNMSLSTLCRMREIGVTNVLTWALDKASATALAKLDMPHYFDPKTFSVAKPTSYYDPEYVRMMTQRPAVWWRMLATGFDLLFLDSGHRRVRQPHEGVQEDGGHRGAGGRAGLGASGAERSHPGHVRGGVLDPVEAAEPAHAGPHERRHREARGEQRFDDQYALNSIIHDSSEAVALNRGPMWNQTWPIQDPVGRLRVLFVEPDGSHGRTAREAP